MFKALQDNYFVVCDVCGATMASSEYLEKLQHYGYTHICDDCKETILWIKNKKKSHLEG